MVGEVDGEVVGEVDGAALGVADGDALGVAVGDADGADGGSDAGGGIAPGSVLAKSVELLGEMCLQMVISDEDVDNLPFYRPANDSPEMVYLRKQRQALGGFVPERAPTEQRLNVPALDTKPFQARPLLPGSDGGEGSTTYALGMVLRGLLRDFLCLCI